jgi:hypothetical protein
MIDRDRKKIELIISGITEKNKNTKFQKAIVALSKELEIPATIEHKENHKESFPFKAQDDLYNIYKNKYGILMDDLYSRLCSTLGINPSDTFKKAIDPLAPKLGREILWNPETGQIITDKEMSKLLKAIDKFMNRNVGPMKEEFTISQAAVSRIISNLRKDKSFEELKDIPLDEIKYKGKPWTALTNFAELNDMFPGNNNRLKFRERVVGNYITSITEDTRSGIRDILDQGFLAGKTKGQISQELFYKFGDLNKDWDRIIDTESVNIFNSEFIEEQKKDVLPGESLYFIRREFGDAKTCPFCMKAVNGQIIAKWSDVTLQDENIKDPVASIALWDGKGNYGKSQNDWQWASGSNHPNCYSDDTEVLTDYGWKLFKDVLPLDKIMSINPETQEVDYLNHKGLISYQYNGEMIHFDGFAYDTLVTPDHNCLYVLNQGRGKYLQGKAKDLIGKNVSMPRGVGIWNGDSRELESQAKSIGISAKSYVKLWAWVLSEGTVGIYGAKKRISISQKYPENIAKDTGNLDFFRYGKEHIYIYDRNVFNLFSEMAGVKSKQKYIPSFILNSEKKYIELFLESYIKGDGNIDFRNSTFGDSTFGDSNRETISTTSSKMMSNLTDIIIKSGKYCSIRTIHHKHESREFPNGKMYPVDSLLYMIHINKSKFRHYHKKEIISKETGKALREIREVPYSGMVYDVELEKWHFLLVKRNGKLAWSGNCRGYWDRYDENIGDLDL